jgi:hypothetical protein
MIRYTGINRFKIDGITYSALKVESVEDIGDNGEKIDDCLCCNIINNDEVSEMTPVAVVEIDVSYYDGKVVIPNTFTYEGHDCVVVLLRDFSFINPEKLIKLYMAKYISMIFSDTFLNCVNLEFVNLPRQLRYIESSAFEGCTKLDNLLIPPLVSYIERYAFKDCTNLKYLFILSYPESPMCLVERNAFEGCTNMLRIGTLEMDPKITKTYPEGKSYKGFQAKKPGVVLCDHADLILRAARLDFKGVDKLNYNHFEIVF